MTSKLHNVSRRLGYCKSLGGFRTAICHVVERSMLACPCYRVECISGLHTGVPRGKAYCALSIAMSSDFAKSNHPQQTRAHTETARRPAPSEKRERSRKAVSGITSDKSICWDVCNTRAKRRARARDATILRY